MQDNTAKKTTAASSYPWLQSYAPGVSWDIDVPRKPLYSVMDEAARDYAARPALSFAGHEYTYADIATLVDRAAAGLQKMGIVKNAKVGMFMPNSGYSIVMYYAILKTGATVVNFNPAYIEADLIAQVTDSETDMLVTLDAPALLSKAAALMKTSRLSHVIVCPAADDMRSSGAASELPSAGYTWFCDLIADMAAPTPVVIDAQNDIAVLQYTGGTTGTPKGAALTHRCLLANAMQIGQWYHNSDNGQDSMVAVLPLFHVFAMTVVMNMSVMKGMRIFIQSQFSRDELLHLIHEQRPSYIAAVPTMYAAMSQCDRISDFDFSSLKFCLSGGAPLPAEIKSAFEKKTGAKLVAEGYGLTEFSPVATCNPLSEKARAGSIGLPIPGTIVEIVSMEDGKTVLPVGEKGELTLRGPQMMQGYYKKQAETENVIDIVNKKDEDLGRRLHTGDVGYMDAQGFVYIVDRMKDMILVGGYNVYPRHIEEVVYTHPAVAECIVAGVPDKMRGEAVQAWVVPKAGQPLDADMLRSFLQGKVSPIEMPRKIIVRNEPLPKTAVGKLSKKDLLAQEGFAK